MDHAMTVCAKKRQVSRAGAASRSQIAHRDDMVALDISLAPRSICDGKVEIAYFAEKSPLLLQRFLLSPFDELAVSLPDAVHPGENAALGSIRDFGILRFGIGDLETCEICPDRGGSAREEIRCWPERVEDRSVQFAPPRHPFGSRRRIKGDEIGDLQSHSGGISKLRILCELSLYRYGAELLAELGDRIRRWVSPFSPVQIEREDDLVSEPRVLSGSSQGGRTISRLRSGWLDSRQIGQDVLEQLAAMVRTHGEVVGRDSCPVERLHAEDIPGRARVGEDAGVGDAEALQVVGQ